jgi:glutamate:Na+ symporter, ESS family
MDFPWTMFINLGIIAGGLLLATFIRVKIPFFQKFLIPNALTAGFLLLPFYNLLAPRLGLATDTLGHMVYHLLNVSFIAMTLRKSPPAHRRGDLTLYSTSMGILSQYAVVAILGLLMTFLFMKTFIPDLFPSFGFLLTIGFVLGPGQAYAIGTGWESFGIEGAGTVGLTFAAIGFLFACFGGVFLINYGIRRGWMNEKHIKAINERGVRTGVYAKDHPNVTGANLTTESEAIDSMTFNVGLVVVVYLISYLFLKGVTFLLSFAGDAGGELAVNLWGINFIFSALVAILVKKIMQLLKIEYVYDNLSMTRISGISVDIMVTAAIGAISIVVVKAYLIPIIITSIIAGGAVLIIVPWFCSRIFTDHQFHRMLMIYGCSTGTLPTGLALLRVIDPEFETPVATDYMYSSGLTFVLAIPFILSINLPVYTFTTGEFSYFWSALLVSAAYLVFVGISFIIISRKRLPIAPTRIWHKEE